VPPCDLCWPVRCSVTSLGGQGSGLGPSGAGMPSRAGHGLLVGPVRAAGWPGPGSKRGPGSTGRLRTSLQARISTTRARMKPDPGAAGTAGTERALRGDLITAETAELTRLYDSGIISPTTRRRLQRNLDLETARLTEGHQ